MCGGLIDRAPQVKVEVYRGKRGWGAVGALSRGHDAHVGHGLALFRENRSHIHAGAGCERGEREFHWPKSQLLTAHRGSPIDGDGIAVGISRLEMGGLINPLQFYLNFHTPSYQCAVHKSRYSTYSTGMRVLTIEECIGNTPLVRLRRLYQGANLVLCKLEGDNPAGSVKDRPAYQMIVAAEERGRISPGDTLIEATSGNTGIALAMVAAVKGYRLILIMPEHMSAERRALMKAYGAEVVLTPKDKSMEGAIDLARQMEADGKGVILDQFSNPDNPDAHYRTTGPEVWRDTDGKVTHFIASTGTTGTLMGSSRYLKEQNPEVRIVGARPDSQGGIPGIRAWPEAYLPKIYDESRLDEKREVSRDRAVATMRDLAAKEGIFSGISSGGNVAVALDIARELDEQGIQDAVIVTIICDRGDRYISTGVFPA